MMDYYLKQLGQAFRRIDYDLQALHEGENSWEPDESDGMSIFRGMMDPFRIQKHIVDLLREVWHIADGMREYIDAAWKAGKWKLGIKDTDKGRGPGKAIIADLIKRNRWVQLCGDLANLSKHYRLCHASKSGATPPALGNTLYTFQAVGKLELVQEGGKQHLKLENRVPVRPTMAVLDEKGNLVGDAVEIAVKARDFWAENLLKWGIEHRPAAMKKPTALNNICGEKTESSE